MSEIKYRIVVFTGNIGYSIRKGIDEIDRTIPNISWLVVLHSPRKRPKQLLLSQWKNLKINGWRWVPYQVRDIGLRITTRIARTAPHRWKGRKFTEASLSQRANIEIRKVADIHSPEVLTAISAFEPVLGLSLAAPILRRPLFSIPKLGTVNLHKGKVPDYRGMPPAFWELWNGESSIGCTIHWVDDKLDTGDVVLETKLDRTEYSTVRGLQLCLDEIGVELMRDAVKKILSGDDSNKKQESSGFTYRKPTLKQIKALNTKLLCNQTPAGSSIKRISKECISTLSSTMWSFGLSKLVKPRIVVLLYHRVSDDVRDNLTVGIEQFDRQMALVRKHCTLLSIDEVLSFKEIPRTRKPFVCVTFDDGYLDNYTNAANILLRNEVPAAFFVSTGLIGTDRIFPHDVRRGNRPIPMMNWEHLRSMRDEGFTIGSHTVNHIDCVKESESVVINELSQSYDDLRRELNLETISLAYPYGSRSHMSSQRLELVKRAGYVGCLSAYGGANIGTVDSFNILRRGIHWEFSDQSLMFECLGLR